MEAFWSPKGGSSSQVFLAWTAGTEDESATACVHEYMCSPFHITYRMLLFVKSVLRKLMSYTLISHTNALAVRGRPTLNDVERIRIGPSTNSISPESWKASQILFLMR